MLFHNIHKYLHVSSQFSHCFFNIATYVMADIQAYRAVIHIIILTTMLSVKTSSKGDLSSNNWLIMSFIQILVCYVSESV